MSLTERPARLLYSPGDPLDGAAGAADHPAGSDRLSPPVELLVVTVRSDGPSGRCELVLRGELDIGGAQRVLDAMAWCRRRGRGLMVVDTRGLTFIDVAGYRALRQALNCPPGEPAGCSVHRAGPVVIALERHLRGLASSEEGTWGTGARGGSPEPVAGPAPASHEG
jgi:hypothetical protein